jgi:ATP-binding cassette subfamily C (CFTR/MRP) protein 1
MKLIIKNTTDHVVHPSPEINASFPSKMLFSWFDGTIKRGWKNPLKEGDLYDLDPESSCKRVMAVWTKHWQQQSDSKKAKGGKLSILPTLIKSFGGLFLSSMTVRLATVLLQQVMAKFS